MSDLLIDLKKIAEDELGIDTKDKIRWPRSSQALGNKLNEAATNLREIGIIIERPDNRASHTKSIVLIKQNVCNGKPETMPLESFPASFPSENGQIHTELAQKPGNGKLGDFTVSVEDENENQVASSAPAGVPESSPTFPSSRSDENHAQIASDVNGKPDGEVKWRAHSCFPLGDVSLSNEGLDEVKVSSITNFFYDDPNKPWEPVPEHDLDQSPCHPIIAIKQNYYYCILHPEVKYIHLKSIEHHIKYKDPAAHKSELLKLPKLTHN
jgi:hypothetical protein